MGSPSVSDTTLEPPEPRGGSTKGISGPRDNVESAPDRRPLGFALLAVAALALVGFFVVDPPSAGDGTLLAGEAGTSEFHQISLTDLDGRPLHFADYEGTPVILNFFASWCGPCVAEMPVLDAIHRDFDGDLVVIGLDPSEGLDAAIDIVAETGVTYPTALDLDGVLLERYDGFGMPTTVFIDGNGAIRDTWIGELTDEAFRERIDNLFGLT